MATTSITFKVEIPSREWYSHPLRKEWYQIAYDHPIYTTLPKFIKLEHNINLNGYKFLVDTVMITFESEQDYILWQLHQ